MENFDIEIRDLNNMDSQSVYDCGEEIASAVMAFARKNGFSMADVLVNIEKHASAFFFGINAGVHNANPVEVELSNGKTFQIPIESKADTTSLAKLQREVQYANEKLIRLSRESKDSR